MLDVLGKLEEHFVLILRILLHVGGCFYFHQATTATSCAVSHLAHTTDDISKPKLSNNFPRIHSFNSL